MMMVLLYEERLKEDWDLAGDYRNVKSDDESDVSRLLRADANVSMLLFCLSNNFKLRHFEWTTGSVSTVHWCFNQNILFFSYCYGVILKKCIKLNVNFVSLVFFWGGGGLVLCRVVQRWSFYLTGSLCLHSRHRLESSHIFRDPSPRTWIFYCWSCPEIQPILKLLSVACLHKNPLI